MVILNWVSVPNNPKGPSQEGAGAHMIEGCIDAHAGMRRTGWSEHEHVQRHRQVRERGKSRDSEFSVAEVKEAIGKSPAGALARGQATEDFTCQSSDFLLRSVWESLKSFKESLVLAASLCSIKITIKQREGKCREELFYGWSFP